MNNEGTLSRHHFGGESAHTGDHPPVFRFHPPVAGCEDMEAGEMLYFFDGLVGPWVAPGEGVDPPVLAGILDIPFSKGEPAVKLLAHGTVKERLLKKAGSTPSTADFLALETSGIFPV